MSYLIFFVHALAKQTQNEIEAQRFTWRMESGTLGSGAELHVWHRAAL